jgi:negative regulator of sigma E activity
VVRWTNDGPGRSPGAGDAQGSAAVGHRRPLILVAVAVVAVVVAIIALLVRPATGSAESSPRTMAPATTTAAPSPTPSAAQIGSPADAAALQEVEVVAAGLTTPVVLTSPAEWDLWAGIRPTYPGDRDIDGCP